MAGELRPDSKLPPARQLATSLGLNKNTVAAVYRELEEEGYLRSHQGSGTFITDYAKNRPDQKIGRDLLKLVDDAIKGAIKLGYSPHQFATVSYSRAHLGIFSEKRRAKALFVGCGSDDLKNLSQSIATQCSMDVQPISLSDLQADSDGRESIEKADLIITALDRYEEVKKILGPGPGRRLVYVEPSDEDGLRMLKSLSSMIEDAYQRDSYTPEIVDSFVKWHLYHYRSLSLLPEEALPQKGHVKAEPNGK
jgi:DNA-binding transcriptional regulator YhcF (GntR family)